MSFFQILRAIPQAIALIEAYKLAKADGKLTLEEIMSLLVFHLVPLGQSLGLIGKDEEIPAIAPELQGAVSAARAKAEELIQTL